MRKEVWTEKQLEKYMKEREEAQFAFIDPLSPARKVKPNKQNHSYRPLRWR